MSTAAVNPPAATEVAQRDQALAARPLTLEDLVAGALQEQQQLTAVDRFAQWHEHHDAAPVQARHYRSLVPTAAPQAGEQYAFDVDLDACSGCKSCVVACHALNGLDDNESWRDVGLLTASEPTAPAALQYVTTACHHCLEPACAIGCPVNAYEKDPLTGIVRHLDDQCFGCTYCTLACPYDVPKYHADKGIVRKCDMCTHRLAAGEAPACVQSCPNEAIRITVVAADEVRQSAAEGSALVPGAVESSFTLPTTRFHSDKRDVSQLRPVDQGQARPQHAHAALVVMLVLTQMAVGVLAAAGLWIWLAGAQEFATAAGSLFLQITASVAALSAVAGVTAATLHLGRPQYAFRALLGVTHSWLSREILAFGVFMPLAVAAAGLAWWDENWSVRWGDARAWLPVVLATAVFAGAVAVWCSVRIYQFTRRPFWVGWHASLKFTLTTAVLGAAVAWCAATWAGLSTGAVAALAGALAAASLGKLGFEIAQLQAERWAWGRSVSDSARLLRSELRPLMSLRLALGLFGGVIAPLASAFVPGGWGVVVATLAVALCAAADLCERTLFFRAVVPLKMPGGLPA